ncbi:hypothetical protein P3X46_031742 [Hevea brasiliensis]|uniref:Uncharacterized protein n=1 Tax=Hevea brasiliensis TaxID=3981 RepID=A0ABQ9KLB4_HEVBR|nr:uncharacterized protein LOC131175402 [Hevea brasiliensis]KAJ9141173.1 hypothetical protein P3X46_031742 [Hevea brasiliensis]
MKGEIIAWLFFIICFKALSYCACEISITPQQHLPMTRAKQLKEVYESIARLRSKDYSRTLERKGLHEVDAKSFQKLAKGVYGGADVLRPRSKSKNGATSLHMKSSALFSATLGLIIYVVFF